MLLLSGSKRYYTFDIETTLDHSKIHMVAFRTVLNDKDEILVNFFDNKEDRLSLNKFIQRVTNEGYHLIGHNVLCFDIPLLKKLWGIDFSKANVIDTLVLSRLVRADQIEHSLAALGVLVGKKKSEFNNFDECSIEMVQYCHQDLRVTDEVFKYLLEKYSEWHVPQFIISSVDQPYRLEHHTQKILQRQEEYGFKMDRDEALELLFDLEMEQKALEVELQEKFEPTLITLKTKVKTVPFNPNSTQQIADRLMKRGWKPTKFTPTCKPVVDDLTLESVTVDGAEDIKRYRLLDKRISQISSWIENLGPDGRIHGKVIGQGTITGRMSHSKPNMAQVPASYSPFGKECRSLFKAPEGRVLVGIDASELELRMLAHYMNDPIYIDALVNGDKKRGTDLHSINMRALGIEDRDVAKTFIYAFLYGAGPAKIATILGCSVKDAEATIAKFLRKVPRLDELRNRIERIGKTRKNLIGLDSRYLYVRNQHSALNTLLQGAGAIVMKRALVTLDTSIYFNKFDAEFVANVHDEWQIECYEKDAKRIGDLGVLAIKDTARYFKLNCPLNGEYKIGKNWNETH